MKYHDLFGKGNKMQWLSLLKSHKMSCKKHRLCQKDGQVQYIYFPSLPIHAYQTQELRVYTYSHAYITSSLASLVGTCFCSRFYEDTLVFPKVKHTVLRD